MQKKIKKKAKKSLQKFPQLFKFFIYSSKNEQNQHPIPDQYTYLQ